MSIPQNNKKYVLREWFIWIVSGLVVASLMAHSFVYNTAVQANDRAIDNQLLIAKIETRLENIDKTLEDISQTLKEILKTNGSL